MGDLSWREAIVRVLADAGRPLHYAEIAERIAQVGLRKALGATPASTVNATITTSLQKDGTNSPFQRLGKGHYTLQSTAAVPAAPRPEEDEPEAEVPGLIRAFGMYWSRASVLWVSRPRILGQQQVGSKEVDFSDQRGVYLLYDGRSVVYVGRTTDQPLGTRLKQHTVDRLNGRWDRFSWFGVYSVSETGELLRASGETYTLDLLITTMEALLIEGLEPPQNRKRGDEFKAVEFLQVQDPDIQKRQVIQLIDELKKKL